MDTASEYEQDHYDPRLLFGTHWRTKPLFVRGGAKQFLGLTWTAADFDAALAVARERRAPVVERPGEVTFIEDVSAYDPQLAALTTELGRTFGSPRVWFDAVRTYSAGGIGAHFDHSDNVVLQQDGIKEWTLAPPRHLDRADIARRMMNLPDVGGHELPEEDCLHFTLHPGDLLYIPLFWLHSGVSRQESLSVSFVSPAVSLQSAVLPFVTRVLKDRAVGHQPIPALHAYLGPAERAEAVAALRRATELLLRRLADDDVVSAVAALQGDRLPGLVDPGTPDPGSEDDAAL